jgi:DNA-binding MarR family transcriptional regulator
MVETIKVDRKHLEPMKMFLLAAVSRAGLNTLYALQRAMGLQPGSLAPVIRSLEGEGLLVRSEGAKRGRRTMSLTDAGERFLAVEWKNSLDSRREMETVLRSATVALLMGEPEGAFQFLMQSAEVRFRPMGVVQLNQTSPRGTPIELHAAMREVYDGRRREMEADVLKKSAEYLMEVARKREGT